MLILKRKIGERLSIDGDIEVIVLDSTSCGVKLGVQAPEEISVRRQGPAGGDGAMNSGAGPGRHPSKP